MVLSGGGDGSNLSGVGTVSGGNQIDGLFWQVSLSVLPPINLDGYSYSAQGYTQMYPEEILGVSGGGFLMYGYIATGGSEKQLLLMRLDNLGNVLWSKSIGSADHEERLEENCNAQFAVIGEDIFFIGDDLTSSQAIFGKTGLNPPMDQNGNILPSSCSYFDTLQVFGPTVINKPILPNVSNSLVAENGEIPPSTLEPVFYGAIDSCCVEEEACPFFEGPFNPYLAGMLGNPRPHKAYTFYAERSSSVFASNQPQIRRTGVIQGFTPFWTYSGNNQWGPTGENDDAWVLSNEMTKYDKRGNELENKNALDIYSAALFDYDKTRPVAVAGNTQLQEIAYDGFESAYWQNNCGVSQTELEDDYRKGQTYLRSTSTSQLVPLCEGPYSSGCFSTNRSHSGLYSLATSPGDTQYIEVNIHDNCFTSCGEESDLNAPYFRYEGGRYYTNCTGCIPPLTPFPDSNYVVSVWVGTEQSIRCGTPPGGDESIAASDKISLRLSYGKVGDDPADYEEIPGSPLYPEGPVVEGWQRIFGTVTIPEIQNVLSEDYRLRIEFLNETETVEVVFFDDFRFHPFRSNLRSFVFDRFSQRLMAELDENNYATFYEYDEEGALIRIKRETERGIMTLQEGRTYVRKKDIGQ